MPALRSFFFYSLHVQENLFINGVLSGKITMNLNMEGKIVFLNTKSFNVGPPTFVNVC